MDNPTKTSQTATTANGTNPKVDAAVIATALVHKVLSGDEVTRDELHQAEASRRRAQQAAGRATERRDALAQAKEALRSLRTRLDPEAILSIPPRWAWGGAGICALFDAVPAYWASQALDLDQADTLVVTVMLMAALTGAMVFLDTSNKRSHGHLVEGVVAAGFVLLFVLRVVFLATVGSEPLALALLQSVALTAISAGLVAIGTYLLRRRLPVAVAHQTRKVHQLEKETNVAVAEAGAARADADRDGAAVFERIRSYAFTHTPENIDATAVRKAARAELASIINEGFGT